MKHYDQEEFRAAIHYCWTARQDARVRQIAEGLVEDVGLRAGVTSGKHLDPLAALVAKVFIDAGMPEQAIHYGVNVELPGFYRSEKQWDLVVVHDKELVAAIEFKSMLGSYGNNMNNRVEEATGNAADLLEAFEEGLLGGNARAPWLGYVFIIQEDKRSTTPVRLNQPHFVTDRAFQDASYVRRIELLCRRLVQKRLYSGASFVCSDGGGPEAVREPADDLRFSKFAAGIVGKVGEVLA
ncbi:MAG: type II site-specific deoxyribonuclease [Nitriliruptorales bacterium]|nr:type II site-specific deoxyribonuclease [Nitriliruptorales bacterium]